MSGFVWHYCGMWHRILTYVCVSVLCVFAVWGCSSADNEGDEVGELVFDVDGFRAINPEPAIRGIDSRIDVGFDEHEKLPKDAISPIYSPKYVDASFSDLGEDDLVMGISINGESRALPVGLMRFREMLNDVVGGVPLLASW